MRVVIHLYIIIFLAVPALSCHAQQDKSNDKLSAFIKQKADSLYKNEKVPGIFIGVLNKGERQYYNYGFANPDLKMPFDSTTIFEIGSLTKTFTAYVLESVLKEKGINDSSTIIKYLPDSVQRNKALEKISFLSLLNHTSGLPRLPANMDLVSNAMTPYDNYTSGDLFAYLKTCIPKPDGKSNYSNLGGGLAGVLAERIAGKTYPALLDEYIFLPFKMVTPDKSISKTGNKSQGYFENNKSDYWNMDVMAPAGGLKCSASEMLTYFQMMAEPGTEKSKSIINQLLEPTVSINPLVKICRAWHTLEQKEKPVIYWHNGGTYGFSTFGAFIKGESKSLIVVVNQFNKNAVSDGLGIAIMKKMLEQDDKSN
jgi:CubicO group peptidase (beta-lactamase class C family)